MLDGMPFFPISRISGMRWHENTILRKSLRGWCVVTFEIFLSDKVSSIFEPRQTDEKKFFFEKLFRNMFIFRLYGGNAFGKLLGGDGMKWHATFHPYFAPIFFHSDCLLLVFTFI
jgi:hypothetical protein